MIEKKTVQQNRPKKNTNQDVKERIFQLYDELFQHNGYGEIKVEMRFLRRGEKEINTHCGKEYHFVVEYRDPE